LNNSTSHRAMEIDGRRSVFGFNVAWDTKSVALFVILLVLPNILGLINIPAPAGFRIHFFQIAVFLAALIYGPKGGLLSGLFGSIYSGVVMHNPYIIAGNAILGFFVGLFTRRGMHTLPAVLLAYAIQLPWLVLTDRFIVGLGWPFLWPLMGALLVSNIVWAIVAHYAAKPAREFIGN
jgi:uncharacterized membrane protein